MRYICLAVIICVLLCGSCNNVSAPELVSFEQLKAQAELPDPLILPDGRAITTVSQWKRIGRGRIKRLFEHYMYGFAPPAPKRVHSTIERIDPAYFGGKATLKQITLRFGPKEAPPIHLLLVTPNAKKSAPVFLGVNFMGNHAVLNDPKIPLSTNWMPPRYAGVVNNAATEASRGTGTSRWPIESVIDRGYAVATFYHGDIDPDKPDFSDGIHPHYYKPGQTAPAQHEWGTIAAWAWGLQRAVDYLITDPDIDKTKIAVMGHSRNGKTALLAGAMDERIGLVISNQSGCGGAAVSRRRVGETVRDINKNFPHWFNDEFKKFGDNEDRLPIDQHMLIALVAPRPVLVCSAQADQWADPQGEFAALKGAESVYKLFGTEGLKAMSQPPVNTLIDSTLGYHIRPGKHGIGIKDWTVFMDYADKHFCDTE